MSLSRPANTVVVLDFETTGLSPNQGDRAIEIGAVKLENGVVTDRFQSLINPNFKVSGFIESYTGISNKMLSQAPSCSEVMDEFASFIDGQNLIAHNASFDQRFLDAEFEVVNKTYSGSFGCSLLVSRRLNQDVKSHKLGDLVAYHQIENDGVFHRALADAEVTASLWLVLLDILQREYGINNPDFAMMMKLMKIPKASVPRFLSKLT